MDSLSPSDEIRTNKTICDWIVAWLANELTIPAETIDPSQTFETYGACSLTIVTMTGDLEDWLGREVDPTLVYDHPTIDALSVRLANAV
jgi:acyl carrier protein